MAAPTGQGVAAVGLPSFPTTGDPRKNCEKFIQKFKDWCELNGWYDSEPATPPPVVDGEGGQPGGDTTPPKPVWLAKGRAMAAFRSAIAYNEEIENVLQTLNLSNTENKDPEQVLKRLKEHFSTSEGVLTERTKFSQIKQEDHENCTAWEARVKELGKRLEYCNTCEDQLLRDKFISGVNNDKLMSKMLDKGHRDKITKEVVPFKAMVQIAKNFEQCEKAKTLMQQAKGPAEQVNYTAGRKNPNLSQKPQRPQASRHGSHENSETCQYCAGPSHPRKECPAKDKHCLKKGCGKLGHFARACRMGGPPPNKTNNNTNPQAHQLEVNTALPQYSPDNNDNDLYVLDMKPEGFSQSVFKTDQTQSYQEGGRKYFSYVKLCVSKCFKSVKVQLDTASTCNTLPESIAVTLIPRGYKLQDFLTSSKAALFTYNNSKIVPVGKLELVAESKTGYHLLTFHVVKDSEVQNKPPLLSGSDCVKLGLVKIQADEVHSLKLDNSKVTPTRSEATRSKALFDVKAQCTNDMLQRLGKISLDYVMKEFKDVHVGLGDFGGPVQFDLNPEVTPIHDAIHRQPVARHKKIKEELDKMEKEGKICRQYEPTAWCSNMTVRETKDKFRICLDPSNTINKAIRVPKHPIPRFEDIIPQLSGAKCFSVADAMSGFTNIPLDHDSSLATTFHTPFGRYRWLRLPYGVSSAPEEYQARQQEALAGLNGICNIADDVLIYGCGESKESAERDHDENLYNFLLRMRQVQLKLNPAKWKFKEEKVTFMGYQLSSEGVSPVPSMVEAVNGMPKPVDAQGVQRFLGMLNFMSKFCPHLSDIVRPMRELTHKDVPFLWTEMHDRSFKQAKSLITTAPTLRYFDSTLPVTLQVDASGTGIGGALLQNNQPVAFHSCTLTPTEQRYAVIEKECLAICLCFDKWDSLLYGKSDITVESDHQPLESIFKKSLNKAPRRLQAMRMRLQRWSFVVKYKKGTLQVIADTLSRAPLPQLSSANLSGEHIFRIEMETLPLNNPGISSATLTSMQKQTATDPVLSKLSAVIIAGWPSDKNLVDVAVRPYFTYKDELTVANGVVYKGQQAIVPQSLRRNMLEKIHKTHLGVGSCIRRAKVCLFWPGMVVDIKNICTSCGVCAQFSSQGHKEPMLSHEVPNLPWSVVSQDLLKWAGKWHLITTCFYSDWIEIDILPNTLSATVIEATKAHFARLGIPDRLVTDNGPQFISSEFKKFRVEYGFEHVTSSPYWSQGNGKAEAAVKVVKRLYQKNTDIYAALLDYRNTPQQGQEHSPAQRLLSRRIRSTLPMTTTLLQPEVADMNLVKSQIDARRARAKYYYDQGMPGSHPDILQGQWVYAKPNPQHKHSAWPYGIVEKDVAPRSYTVSTPFGKIRRNRTQLRMAAPPPGGAETYMSQQAKDTELEAGATSLPQVTDTICDNDITPSERQLVEAAPTDLHTESNLPFSSQVFLSQPIVKSPGQAETQVKTRSGRIVKPPKILDL